MRMLDKDDASRPGPTGEDADGGLAGRHNAKVQMPPSAWSIPGSPLTARSFVTLLLRC